MTDLPLDTSSLTPMPVEAFADFAVEAAIWLVHEAMDAIANQTTFDPNPENCFKVLGRLPGIRSLGDLTEEQRFDMFVEGFRRIPGGAQAAFELLLSHHQEMLREALQMKWSKVANERP
jgi:hypothetical protein